MGVAEPSVDGRKPRTRGVSSKSRAALNSLLNTSGAMAMRVDVSDVYDAATKIGREFQRLIEQYGTETLSDLLAMVVSALEQLENMVDQLGEAYKENDRLCVELSQLEAEKAARHKLSKEKKVLKELLMQRDNDVEEYKAILQANERKQAELSANLQSLEEVAANADESKKQAQELQERLSTMVQLLKEQEEQLKEKCQEIEELSEQLRNREQAVNTAPAHEVTTTHLEQKLADVEKTLAQKDKDLSDKASKVQQLGRQLQEQKAALAKMEQANADCKDAQEKLTKLQKQVEAKDKHISERNRQMKQFRSQMEDKDSLLVKAGTERRRLQERVTQLEKDMQEKERQLDVKSRKVKQLNKQLVEQQNAIPAGDKHENGTETTTSDPQLDGVLAHKEKIAKLEDELETAKHEHRKTMDKLKRLEQGQQSPEGEPHAVKGSRLKTSASDSKLVSSRRKAKLEVTDDLGVHCEEEEPEFYRSDLLSVLKEKTNYMNLYFDAEDEIALLREQFRSMQELHMKQSKQGPSIARQRKSAVRGIMEKTVTLPRGYSLSTHDNSLSVSGSSTHQ